MVPWGTVAQHRSQSARTGRAWVKLNIFSLGAAIKQVGQLWKSKSFAITGVYHLAESSIVGSVEAEMTTAAAFFSASVLVQAAPAPVVFFLSRPRLRWLLSISLWFCILTMGESFAGAVAVDSSMSIHDLGFVATSTCHSSLAASPPWVLHLLASVNTLFCVVVLSCGLLTALRDDNYGVIVCMYCLLSFRLLLGLFTALPRSPQYLYSVYDQPNAMATAFIHLYSGHCSILTLYGMWLWTKHKLFAVLVHLCNAAQWIFMLSSRGHYTVDLVIALLLGIFAAKQVDTVSQFVQRQEEWLLRQLEWKKQKRAASGPSLPPQQEAEVTKSLSTGAFRAQYRQRYPYPAWLQIGGLTLSCLLSLACCVWILCSSNVSVGVSSYVTFVGGLVLFNGVEYVLHHFWQHRTRDKSHMEHHCFFTKKDMHAESFQDLYAIMQELPSTAVIVLVVLPVLSLGLGWILALLLLGGAEGLFHFAAYLQIAFTLYYVSGEAVHFYHHRPPAPSGLAESLAWRVCCQMMWLPPFSWLKAALCSMSAHHAQHHDPALMQRWNRNISFPLFDFLFGSKRGKVKLKY